MEDINITPKMSIQSFITSTSPVKKRNKIIIFLEIIIFSLLQIIFYYLIYNFILFIIGIIINPGIFSGGISDLNVILISIIGILITLTISVICSFLTKGFTRFYPTLIYIFILLVYYIPIIKDIHAYWVLHVKTMDYLEYLMWEVGRGTLPMIVGLFVVLFFGYVIYFLKKK